MQLKNIRTIFLLGKSRAFNEREFLLQLSYHQIELLKEYSDKVDMVVEGRMMTPYEQNLSEELYEKFGVMSVTIDALERELVKSIDPNPLLMSLKLSKDKERLKTFIQNSAVDDTLFFKLVKLYNFQGEGFFENDDNRDVSAAFISRFYQNIERNHNIQYAPTGFMHLVSQTQRQELLDAIYVLEPTTKDSNLLTALAMSPFISLSLQKKLLVTEQRSLLEALSYNPNLALVVVKELLKDESLAINMAQSLRLTEESLELLGEYKEALAFNETLPLEYQENFVKLGELKLLYALAQNDAIESELLATFLTTQDEKLQGYIYKNSKLPTRFIEEAYKEGRELSSIAQNESTPIEILYQLQLDSRYERYVRTNEKFGRHIQSENIGWLV